MSTTRVTESRAYDTHYDPTYTSPFSHNPASDPRVKAAMSSTNAVSGQGRYKYFRRPVMPRVNAIPPEILLAPTVTQDPMKEAKEEIEPMIKDAEVQTMYRESEAQTTPYTPNYNIPGDTDPEVLLLKNLTYDKGLPLGKKEVEMVLQARRKNDVESNLPPFTDEASLIYRKRLMEQQEMREFKLREEEMDQQRFDRLVTLEQALRVRNETCEYLGSQRVEAMRFLKLDEREKVLQKIRTKRIKVLRRLAHARNHADPVLSDGRSRDIIHDYFDKASSVYAPNKRNGVELDYSNEKFDVASRTAPLSNIKNLNDLVKAVPSTLTNTFDKITPEMVSMSKTVPMAFAATGGGRAAEHRMTSAARQSVRDTKRDLEEMHSILQKKKLSQTANVAFKSRHHTPATASTTTAAADTTTGGGIASRASTAGRATSALGNTVKGRPVTPDLTSTDDADVSAEAAADSVELSIACMLLQRLIRGRAVQNIMYEGKLRRQELIRELRAADEMNAIEATAIVSQARLNADNKMLREQVIRETSTDLVIGGITANTLYHLSQEHERISVIQSMQQSAVAAYDERRRVEAAEAGRRQRDSMQYPAVSVAE